MANTVRQPKTIKLIFKMEWMHSILKPFLSFLNNELVFHPILLNPPRSVCIRVYS